MTDGIDWYQGVDRGALPKLRRAGLREKRLTMDTQAGSGRNDSSQLIIPVRRKDWLKKTLGRAEPRYHSHNGKQRGGATELPLTRRQAAGKFSN